MAIFYPPSFVPFMPRQQMLPQGQLWSVSAASELILSASASQNVQWPVAASASLILSAAASQNVQWPVAASASLILSAMAVREVEWPVAGSAEIILTATAVQNVQYPASASAELILSAACTQHVAWPVAGSAEIILSAAGSTMTEWAVAATAELIFTAGSVTRTEWVVAATAELILTATAVGVFEAPTSSTAVIVFTATASQTVDWDNMLVNSPLAVIFLAAGASARRALPGIGGATLLLSAAGDGAGGNRTANLTAQATLILRARARVPGPPVAGYEDYLGRFQQGGEVPLEIQCLQADGTPGLPDTIPSARMYCDGILVGVQSLPAVGDDIGRFGGLYRVGRRSPAGRYEVIFWYFGGGKFRVQLQVFEVVPGGDAAGPVIASQVFERPGSDLVVSQLGSGALVMGQSPYLDEGV